MNTLLNRSSLILFFLISSPAFSQNLSWPILASDDPTSFYKSNCSFCEIHNGGISFHQGIDIDATNSSTISIRPVADGVVINKYNSTIRIQHNLGNNVVRYSTIHEFTPSPNLSIGSSVIAGATVLGNIDVSEGHLHIEFSYLENGIEFKMNPLNNSLNWHLDLPTDHQDSYDPQINNVFIIPLANEPNSQYSGFEISETNGAITEYSNSSGRIHLENWNSNSSDPIYTPQNNKLVVFGSIGFIANARDKGINTVPGPGTSSGQGLTVKNIEYFVDYNQTSPPVWGNLPKYQLDFDKINYDHRNRIDWVYNTNNTQLSPLAQMYGNDDYIKMYTTHNEYIWPQRPVNGIQSNGKWYTKINSTSNHLSNNSPSFSELAFINSQAKYTDGIHYIRFRATDASGLDIEHTIEVIIDNFRPYISRVKVYEGTTTTPIYNRGWNCANNKMYFEPAPESPIVDYNQNARIEIIASEPMNSVRLQVNGFDELQTCGTDLNKTHWEFNVPYSQLLIGNNILRINGIDLAENGLQNDPSVIPIRLSSGWSYNPCEQGMDCSSDTYHSFIYGTTYVDFNATQVGYAQKTIQFSDKSVPATSWFWNFGDNSPNGTIKDPVHGYANLGVYFVQHDIQASGLNYSITKPVTVVPLTNGEPDYGYEIVNSSGKNNQVKVNFFSDCKGIIDTYTWEKDGVVFSYEKNPKNVILDEGVQYAIKLTIKNDVGSESITKYIIIDPATYPYGCIHDWEVTYFLHDLEISTENFDENQPFDFSIDFGDGTSDAVSGHYLPYYTFTHQYFTTGSFVVFATVKGKDYSGHDVTLRFAKEISVSQDELEVNILPDNGSSPVHPLQKVTFNATVDGPQCQDGYWGSWAVLKTGNPTFYYSKNFSGQTIEPLEYSFPSPGIYRIIIDVIENVSNPGLGHCEYTLEVTPAPKFIDCEIATVPSLLSLNADYTFYGNTFPIGDPGVAEVNWFPTNVRWTLIKSDGTKQVLKEEEFPYTNSIFSRYVTYHFTESGYYTLRMESWNNTYDYEQNGQLDPQYANTISYYDYDEIQFYVSADIASLTITEPVDTYFEPDANATTLIIKITNPSSSQINWTAEQGAGCGYASWFYIPNTSGNGLCCGNEHSIPVVIDANPEKENRFGCVKIVGKYPNGTEVQGSPAYIQIDQYGTDGPAYALIEGEVLNHYFGESVAIEGRLAVIGSPSTNNSAAGEAFIYEKSSVGTWEKQCTLKCSDNNPDFGSKVDISGDNVCVSGEHKIYFFKKSLPNWSGNIFESKMVSLPFVSDVSIWGDYAVAGVPSDDEKGTNAGAVFVYYRNQSGIDNWGLVEKINDCNSQDYFGNSVDIYNDVLVVGAPQKDAELGYIKIYNRNYELMNDWGLEQTIYGEYSYACSGWNMKFGKSVSIFENVISAPYYQIYNSINGPIPEILFPIYSKNNGIWSLIANDYLIPDPSGNGITSTSIYKDIDHEENIEPQYQYESYSGFPSAFHTDGTSGCDAQSYFFKYYNTTLYRLSWGGYSTYDDLYTRKGNSVSLSYNSSIVGIPGMKQGNNIIGAVEINRKANKSDLCEAEISLSLINFNLPAGTYSDVVAESIALGGRAFPATIQSGATIAYQANEILLQDGFLADHGSFFTAESQECESTLSDAPDKSQWNLVDINKWPLNDESKRYLIKTYMKALPDLPWQSIDVASKIDFEESSTSESRRDNTEQNSNRFFPSVGSQTMDGNYFPVIVITDLIKSHSE